MRAEQHGDEEEGADTVHFKIEHGRVETSNRPSVATPCAVEPVLD